MPELRVEISPKRVRAVHRGRTVADTVVARLVWGDGRGYPVYWLPEVDVDLDAVPTELCRRHPDLPGLVHLEWAAMDRWLEEDEQVFDHPHDPFHRVDVRASSRHVRIELDGVLLAESHAPRLLFETRLPVRIYLPAAHVRHGMLRPSTTTTTCPYKGTAVYWSVDTGRRRVDDVVWSYPVARPEAATVAGMLAFYDEQVEVTVDGERWDPPMMPRAVAGLRPGS